MALRGKKPEDRIPRLKCLLYGEYGVGKTLAAIALPKPFIIDSENGTRHYSEEIAKQEGVVFDTTSLDETIEEVRKLGTEDHGYLSLIIDPFTNIYDAELDIGEKQVGTDYGSHYKYAKKGCSRLYSLLAALDMNVVITAHAKSEYGDNMKVTGQIPDCWKKLVYLMDLVFHLSRDKQGRRLATVKGTRLKEFKDQEVFEWGYGALMEKYGKDKLERPATTVSLATSDQVTEFGRLLAKLSESERKRLKIDKTLAEFPEIEDMPSERIAKGIELLKKHLDE